MEIIKPAKKLTRKQLTYVKKCKECRCIFTYKLSETFANQTMVGCPNCGYWNDVLFHRKYKGGVENGRRIKYNSTR